VKLGVAGIVGSVVVALGCGLSSNDGSAGDEMRMASGSPPWLYEGPVPVLDSPSMIVSLTGHTLRVTGALPEGFDASQLPDYVVVTDGGGRTMATIVYPIATGAKNPQGQWNNVPNVPPNPVPRYDHLNVRPYRPNDSAGEAWGGFPFLNYHDQRRFAFHGPIDFVEDGVDNVDDGTTSADWRLVRGRVSHGCNRMQGEHVLELTHLLGFDMTKPYSTSENVVSPTNGVPGKWIATDLVVLDEPNYDTFANPAHGGAVEIVDVDYPKHPTVPAWPEGAAVMTFSTWDANVMRAWACPVLTRDSTHPERFDGHYCARTNGG
jgi:hypothetical protein